jgi:hypothetical protein
MNKIRRTKTQEQIKLTAKHYDEAISFINERKAEDKDKCGILVIVTDDTYSSAYAVGDENEMLCAIGTALEKSFEPEKVLHLAKKLIQTCETKILSQKREPVIFNSMDNDFANLLKEMKSIIDSFPDDPEEDEKTKRQKELIKEFEQEK